MHSLTGASSAKRWMNCSGYLSLAGQTSADPNRLDPEYTREGTAAHTIAALCLRDGRDAWEFSGKSLEGMVIGEGDGKVSPTAIQEYINECRRVLAIDPDNTEHWIETVVSDKDHPGFYGTLDFGALILADPLPILVIRDLKMGEGVYVEVKENEQVMYYAYGLIRKMMLERGGELDPRTPVDLGVVQPRHWEYSGVSTWTTTVGYILNWGDNVLLPDMKRRTQDAKTNPTFVPGEWCRFCPVKLKCPAMIGMFGAAMRMAQVKADPKAMTNEELGRDYSCVPMVEMFLKALKGEVDHRAQNGAKDDHWKLVKKKMDRTWKDGAFVALRNSVGEIAMTSPVLKSPAQMEKISDYAKRLVAEWAYTPDGGLVATHPETDRRLPEKAVTLADTFAGYETKQVT